MDVPQSFIAPRFIHTLCQFASWETQAAYSALASAVWPAANRALYIPIMLPFRFNVRRLFVANGATTAGDVDLAIYSLGGTRIVSLGAGQAQSGASAIQYFTLSPDILLPPGAYFIGMSASSGSATFIRSTPAAEDIKEEGVYQQATAHPLPSSMTVAAPASAYVPLCGVTSTSSGF
jgi:hypothetical protein